MTKIWKVIGKVTSKLQKLDSLKVPTSALKIKERHNSFTVILTG
jgi:hypothetical protein